MGVALTTTVGFSRAERLAILMGRSPGRFWSDALCPSRSPHAICKNTGCGPPVAGEPSATPYNGNHLTVQGSVRCLSHEPVRRRCPVNRGGVRRHSAGVRPQPYASDPRALAAHAGRRAYRPSHARVGAGSVCIAWGAARRHARHDVDGAAVAGDLCAAAYHARSDHRRGCVSAHAVYRRKRRAARARCAPRRRGVEPAARGDCRTRYARPLRHP